MKKKNNETGKEKITKSSKIPKHIREIPPYELGEALLDSDYTSIGIVGLFIVAMVFLASADDDVSLSPGALIFTLLLFIISLYFIFGRKKYKSYREKHPPVMQGDGISYPGLFGKIHKHSYFEWADSVNAGHFRVGPRGFEFWLGRERINFFYNVGITKAREDSKRRYDVFRQYLIEAIPMVEEKLPEFTKKNVDLLDKRCFYKRSRRNQLLVLLCNLVAFLYFNYLGGNKGVLLTCFICGLVEFCVLYFLVKGAYYHFKNENAIREALPDDVGLIRDDGLGSIRPYWGFIYATLVLAINYGIQYMIIWQ